MCKECTEDSNWYYVDNGRAMVSLGPLNDKRTCPYSCAFCYVQDGFVPYIQKDIDEIVDFLLRHRNEYEIIYISGDTDSFAEPRRKKGILLLQKIVEKINCDLLFTTRTVFNEVDLCAIAEVVQILKRKNKLLFACISITRYSDSVRYLEPAPIPSPDERIDTLKQLHDIGAVTVVALRPFLPVVPENDYLSILKRTVGYADIALGETFFFVSGGRIEKRVFINGIPDDVLSQIEYSQMDFNSSDEEWAIWQSEVVENKIADFCRTSGIIFSMRSSKAIAEYKAKYFKN